MFGNLKDETLNMIENEYEYRSLGISQPLDREYEKTLEKNYKLAIRSNVLQGSMTPLYHATALLGVIFIIYFGGLNYQIGAWEIDAFSAYLTTYALIATKASKVGKMVNAAQKGKIAWGRFKYLLRDYSPKIKKEISFPIKLELQNVSFGFDQHCRFQNLNYSFKSGEVIGISGPVYSGKSTFASLLSGLYKYDGTIKVNGEELEKMQKEYETNLLGVMSFNNDIFSMTVKENIELGRKGEFDKVFSIVGLDKEIDESTNPFSLSGGQKEGYSLLEQSF